MRLQSTPAQGPHRPCFSLDLSVFPSTSYFKGWQILMYLQYTEVPVHMAKLIRAIHSHSNVSNGQCFGSMIFWNGSGSVSAHLRKGKDQIRDPEHCLAG